MFVVVIFISYGKQIRPNRKVVSKVLTHFCSS